MKILYDIELIENINRFVWKGVWQQQTVIVKLFPIDYDSNYRNEYYILKKLSYSTQYRFQQPLKLIECDQPSIYYDKLTNDDLKLAAILILEYIEGVPLSDCKEKLTPIQLCDIFNRLRNIIQYIHRENIIHFDIQNQNVIITPAFDVVLIDFGFSFSNDCITLKPCRWVSTHFVYYQDITRDYKELDYYHFNRLIKSNG